jgi:ribosome-associated protein
MIPVTPKIALDENELEERFIRSPGPGGQNVNKLSTAVQLRFDVARSPSLPDDVRRRLVRIAGRRISTEGILTIEAHRFRTRERNRQDAVERLVDLVRLAAHQPKPRKPTRPTIASKERRLASKRQRSMVKRHRGTAPSDD